MEYESFVEQFQKELINQLPIGTELQREDVLKNNGVMKDAIVVNYPDTNMSPTVYLDDLYHMNQEGYSISDIAETTTVRLAEYKDNAPAIPNFSEASARDNLYCAVINKQDNENLLSSVPHEDIEDLAIVARYKVGDNGSFLVNNSACKAFQMTPEEVLEAAHMNTDTKTFSCQPITDVIRDIMSKEGVPESYINEMLDTQVKDCPFWVMSNGNPNGAAVITSPKAMKSVYQKFGEGYYVLPSSRHEVILMPESKTSDVDFLTDMVKTVNATTLQKTDKLSDSVYHYDGRKLSRVDSAVSKTKDTLSENIVKNIPKAHKR